MRQAGRVRELGVEGGGVSGAGGDERREGRTEVGRNDVKKKGHGYVWSAG